MAGRLVVWLFGWWVNLLRLAGWWVGGWVGWLFDLVACWMVGWLMGHARYCIDGVCSYSHSALHPSTRPKLETRATTK